MADTFVDKIAVADETDFPFNFPYLEDEHVKVYIDDVEQSDGTFTISTTPEVRVILNTGATAGEKVRVRRKSQPNVDLVDFVNGSVLTETELDRAYRHNRYLAEEAGELSAAALDLEGVIQSNQIADGAVGTTKLDDGAVSTIKIADDAVNASKLDETVSYTVNGLSSTGNVSITGDLNITGDYKVNGSNLIPTGMVSAYAGNTAPTGYALCNGSAVNRTAQAALFAVIGTTYGIGDGSTTFNLPDLRGRVVAGLGESLLGATPDTLGENNGLIADTKTHLLTVGEMPAHDHGGSSSEVIDSNGTELLIPGAGAFSFTALPSAGGGLAHNNVQPTIILNYIIKT